MRRDALLAAPLILAALLFPSSAAQAEDEIPVTTSPTEGSILTQQPGSLQITAPSALLDVYGSNLVDVVGPDQRHFVTGCPVVSGSTVSATALLGPSGTYTLEWHVVLSDGSVSTGSTTFDWEPLESEQVGAGTSAAPYCGSGSTLAASPATESEETASSEEAQDADGTQSSEDTADMWRWIAGGLVAAIVAAGAIAAAFRLRHRDRQTGTITRP